MARLFSDEDFPYPAVLHLRSLGHDVRTAKQAGLAGVGTTDDIILACAILLRRTVLTMNKRHFIALHRSSTNHCGIVVCSHDSDGVALANRIDSKLATVIDLKGQLIRVNRV